MLSHRLPALTEQILEQLAEPAGDGCLAQLSGTTTNLDHAGFLGRPTWAELRDGERLPRPISSEPGEWQHDWHCHASSSLEYHFRATVIVAQSDAAKQAHLRSHARPRGQRGLVWSSCRVGVQGGAAVVPGAGAREAQTPFGCDRCLVRVRWQTRLVGQAAGSLPTLRTSSITGTGH